MLETYSNATIINSHMESNEAADNGGAIYLRRRCKLKIIHSTLLFNKANTTGGSILAQHSQAIVESCTFVKGSAIYGGAISAENVADIVIQASLFHNCTASYGGSISVDSESILRIEHSNMSHNLALSNGGGAHINQNSLFFARNVTISDAKSVLGAGIYVSDASKLDLKMVYLLRNTVKKSGAAIFCRQSKIIVEEGHLVDNYAKIHGGGVFGHGCHAIFDHSKLVNNTGSDNGGGIHFDTSIAEVYNTEGANNNAEKIGYFAVITLNSMFYSNHVYLSTNGGNSIAILKSSKAKMKSTYLSNTNDYCPILAKANSDVHVDPIYFTDSHSFNATNTENAVCVDESSNSNGTFKGFFWVFLFHDKIF